MGPQYKPEELLHLRESPLVAKPANLPPAEEWMGPLLEQAQKKPRESVRSNDVSTRRPALTDARHVPRGSNTIPDDIVLGPPKTSFASASSIRTLPKNRPSLDKAFEPEGDESGSNDRYHNRELSWQDKDRNNKFGDLSRESRFGYNDRDRNKEGRETWSSGRFRKSYGQNEFSRLVRGTDTPEGQDQNLSYKDSRKDSGWSGDRERRNGRKDPPWFKETEPSDHTEPPLKESSKHTDWRDRHRAPRGDGDRWSNKNERDPEWMENSDREESKKAHTAEEFEKWKEQYKASNSKSSAEKEPPVLSSPIHEEQSAAKTETQLALDPNLDKFFGSWTSGLGGKEPKVEEAKEKVSKEPLRATLPKTSRFTSLFSPPPPPVVRDEPSPIPQTEKRQNVEPGPSADQEGFQRILQMLGGGNAGSQKSTPVTEQSPYPKPPGNGEPEQGSARAMPMPMPMPMPSTSQERIQEEAPYRRPSQAHGVSQSPMSPMLEHLIRSQSPKETSTHNRDTELLLKLMQQARVSSAPLTPQSNIPEQPPSTKPGILPMPEYMNKPQMQPKERPQQNFQPGFFDDPAIAASSRGEIPDQIRRRPTNGNIGIPADAMADFQRLQVANPGQRSQGLPPGLQRPPGLEHIQTNWPNHQFPPIQQPQINPPPGFQNAPPRANANNNGLFSLPPYANASPNDPNPLPPRRGPVGFPPPGFGQPQPRFSAHGLPPNFQSMQSPTDPMLGGMPGQGQFGSGGGNALPPNLPQQYYLEMMLNESARGGGPLGQGQFR
ncbi:MAG: hypothetical protein M1834_006965 [Cirrosporium novae-zelandiae]|nr:MAG: hypothetical protein M1834_006965 [Cirrosporium novae-zelandiae]